MSSSQSTLSSFSSTSSSSTVASSSRRETKEDIFELSPRHELRFESVDSQHEVILELLQGSAEIFGSDLDLAKTYTFRGVKRAAFTWTGCRIRLSGYYESYIADETPMDSYLNTHMALEELRANAKRDNSPGPRVLIAGPTDVGKSSLCHILVGYAARCDQKVLYVDLDVGQNSIVTPGMVCAVPCDEPFSVTTDEINHLPLCFFYGDASPDNLELYRVVLRELASASEEKMRQDLELQAGGMVINTCGWVEKSGFSSLLESIRIFSASIVLVLGDDKLYSALTSEFGESSESVAIRKLSKSGGAVSRSRAHRTNLRIERIRRYFYGQKMELSPRSLTLKFDEVNIFQIGAAPAAPSSALPIGMVSLFNALKVTRVSPSSALDHCILGVLHTQESSDESVLSAACAGILHVQKVDTLKRQLTLLSPTPNVEDLPSRNFLLGKIQWLE